MDTSKSNGKLENESIIYPLDSISHKNFIDDLGLLGIDSWHKFSETINSLPAYWTDFFCPLFVHLYKGSVSGNDLSNSYLTLYVPEFGFIKEITSTSLNDFYSSLEEKLK